MLDNFFKPDGIDLPGLADWLDSLDHAGRLAGIQGLSKKRQAELFEAAAGHRALTTQDFVPDAVGAGAEVIHHGRNSMPMFTGFQKRFLRPEGADADEVWGYNEQTFRTFTGPGYFVAYPKGEGEVLIDYTRLPDQHPGNAWPKILSNSARLSVVIYNGTQDLMRGVSQHVSIGRASRKGEWMDNWFVLVRDDG